MTFHNANDTEKYAKARQVPHPPTGGKAFRAYWRATMESPWQTVKNQNGNPVAYMTKGAALAGAMVVRGEA